MLTVAQIHQRVNLICEGVRKNQLATGDEFLVALVELLGTVVIDLRRIADNLQEIAEAAGEVD